MGAAAPIIGLALTAVGTAAAIKTSRDAADEQKDIQRQQAASAAQKRIEEKRAAHRRRRIAQANILQAAENTGATGSSGAEGAVMSASTQTAAQRTGIAVRENAEQNIFKANQNLADLKVQGDISTSVVGLGQSIFAAS